MEQRRMQPPPPPPLQTLPWSHALPICLSRRRRRRHRWEWEWLQARGGRRWSQQR
jgi:hypothetical protein